LKQEKMDLALSTNKEMNMLRDVIRKLTAST